MGGESKGAEGGGGVMKGIGDGLKVVVTGKGLEGSGACGGDMVERGQEGCWVVLASCGLGRGRK